MSSRYQRIEVEQQGVIGYLWLNRPQKRNALDRLTVDEAKEAIEAFIANDDIRAVVIGGRGTAFCAGADLAYLQELSEYSITENMEDSAALAALLDSIYRCPKPVIARVHGHAIAGGCGLATVCDIVLAVRSVKFGYTEVAIGFIPAIVSAFLQHKAPAIRTRELLLTGAVIDAADAYERGLVTRLLEDEGQLDQEIHRLAEQIEKTEPTAVRLTKEMLVAMEGMSLEAALDYAARMNAAARMTPGCQEGIRSFLDS